MIISNKTDLAFILHVILLIILRTAVAADIWIYI